MALYLSVFVGVVQSFQKMAFLHTLAPNGSEPPLVVAQGLVLLMFVALGFLAVKRFRPACQSTASVPLDHWADQVRSLAEELLETNSVVHSLISCTPKKAARSIGMQLHDKCSSIEALYAPKRVV
jgi:hypothetical protein